MKVLKIKLSHKMLRADKVKDMKIMRQLHKELYGLSWPYFLENQYDELLSCASKYGYCVETEIN